jgi:hypothetical protein
MFFLRLTLYTCVFYLAIALPIILGEFAIEHWMAFSASTFTTVWELSCLQDSGESSG